MCWLGAGRGNLCDRYVPWSHYSYRSDLVCGAAAASHYCRLISGQTSPISAQPPPTPHHHSLQPSRLKNWMLSVLQNAVHELNEKCWDLCVEGKPSNRLDRGQENCLRNCVERFLGTTILLHQALL